MSSSVDALRKKIEQILTTAKVTYRDRGERVSVQRGSSAVFLKPTQWREQSTIIEMVSPVLSGVEKSPALLEQLNALNMSLYFGKAYWFDRGVWLAHHLLGDHIDDNELLAALGMLGGVADKIDDELKAKFGGTRWSDA